MMNETDSQSDSIIEEKEKPLSLDQQQQHEENIAVDSHASSSLTPLRPPNLPKMDLIEGPRQDYLEIVVPLYKASIKGDWKAAKSILSKYPELVLVRCSITENGDTSLHVAASAKSSKKVEKFVENLVKLMTKEDLALENNNYNTALYLAAAGGNIKTVKTMMEKNATLHTIPGGGLIGQMPTMVPLYTAALNGNYEVVKYLYEKSNYLRGDDGWTPQRRGWFLEKCVEGDMFDIAFQFVVKYPQPARYGSLLAMMAQKPEAFQEEKLSIIERIIKIGFSVIGLKAGFLEKEPNALKLLKIIWNDIAERRRREVEDIMRGRSERIDGKKAHPNRILFVAAELGNTKFVVEIIREYPDLIWMVNEDGHTIFHTAVKHRREGIYNLLYELVSMKDYITSLLDENDNNMLHLVGISAKRTRLQDVSGEIGRAHV